jgi:hypothetical protein
MRTRRPLKSLSWHEEQGASNPHLTGDRMGFEVAFRQKSLAKPCQRDQARGEGIGEGRAGRQLQLPMNMLVVDPVEEGIKQFLQVRRIAQGLMGQFGDEPALKLAMVRLDLAVGGRVARTSVDPMDAQDGQPLAEAVGIVGAAAVGVELLRQPPARGGAAKGGHGGAERLAGDHQRGQDKPCGIIEDREDAQRVRRAIGESDREHRLGIGVPDVMGMGGLKTTAQLRVTARAAA